MKKIAALVISVLIVGSLSGCTNRNTGYRNQSNGMNPGINQGTRTGYGINNRGTIQGAYRDGIYTGEGDKGANGNQTATVVISGSRITDITLRTVDAQGKETSGNIGAATGIGNTTGTGAATGVGNTTGTGAATGMGNTTGTGNTTNTPGTGFSGTPGATTGGANGGMAGNMTGTPRGNTGYVSGDNGSQNMDGNVGGIMGRTTTGTSSYDSVRRQIATSMINQQTSEITLNGNDDTISRNWKIAVRRALDKARTGGTTSGSGTGTMGGASK